VARTIWVLGDQLNRSIGALAEAVPGQDRVLLIEAADLLTHRRHRQRTHLVLAALRRFALDLRAEGFEVDLRPAADLRAGVAAHRQAHQGAAMVGTEANSRSGRDLQQELDIEVVASNQFLCHEQAFAAWADARAGRRLRMEDFYRWQRLRLGVLVDGSEPVGGRWNYDAENRQPPPREGNPWPDPIRWPLDDLDHRVLADLDALGAAGFGAEPTGWWPTSRTQALERLDQVIDEVLAVFGPHEDAIVERSWHLAHTLLTPALNLGLLLPGEVVDAAEAAHRAGRVPIASAEGFIRQIIGWREYVWGLSWWFGPQYRRRNELDAHEPLPPAFTDPAATSMRCVAHAADGVHERGWVHHIQRLMVFTNLATLVGVEPEAVLEWMTDAFVDGADWVMEPNVIGMGLHADGGEMSTKPYVSGGRYLAKMSDHCRSCWFRPTERVGEQACPFTTLYWDFLDRHRERFARNPRMAQAVRGLDRLGDLPQVRERAVEVRVRLAAGSL
jgi:deoxyribodipyrimidine photolyase-related protein